MKTSSRPSASEPAAAASACASGPSTRTLAALQYAWAAILCATALAAGTRFRSDPLVLLLSGIALGLGLMNLAAAWCLARGRGKMLSLLTASLNCLLPPLGTALGVTTIRSIHRTCRGQGATCALPPEPATLANAKAPRR